MKTRVLAGSSLRLAQYRQSARHSTNQPGKISTSVPRRRNGCACGNGSTINYAAQPGPVDTDMHPEKDEFGAGLYDDMAIRPWPSRRDRGHGRLPGRTGSRLCHRRRPVDRRRFRGLIASAWNQAIGSMVKAGMRSPFFAVSRNLSEVSSASWMVTSMSR